MIKEFMEVFKKVLSSRVKRFEAEIKEGTTSERLNLMAKHLNNCPLFKAKVEGETVIATTDCPISKIDDTFCRYVCESTMKWIFNAYGFDAKRISAIGETPCCFQLQPK
ncbi:MAG: hypothetical protein LWW95_11525 [Candidatus Desulfofervidus auxilii]|nr:hypothetical protein [Candidatus Desulfofervidus auxilii]